VVPKVSGSGVGQTCHSNRNIILEECKGDRLFVSQTQTPSRLGTDLKSVQTARIALRRALDLLCSPSSPSAGRPRLLEQFLALTSHYDRRLPPYSRCRPSQSRPNWWVFLPRLPFWRVKVHAERTTGQSWRGRLTRLYFKDEGYRMYHIVVSPLVGGWVAWDCHAG